MERATQNVADAGHMARLKAELEAGIASGISKRTPAQIRADFRKAREAA